MIEEILCDFPRIQFWEETFEKKPAILGNNHSLSKIFSIDDFDQYISDHEGGLHDRVRISLNGKAIDIPSYLGHAEPQRSFIISNFSSGATLKLEDLEFRHGAISKICTSLEQQFGGHCFAKPFLTGPNHHGLNVHFDTTEVFVIQLEGTKEWKIWARSEENPTLAMQRRLDPNELGDALIQTTLTPGDILYIPAGAAHAARSLDTSSLHMAIGLTPVKLFELLENQIRIMSESTPILRKNIFPWSNKKEVNLWLKETINSFRDIEIKDIINNTAIATNATKPDTSSKRLRTVGSADQLNIDTRLELRQGISVATRQTESTLRVYYSSTLSKGKPAIEHPTFLQMPITCVDAVTKILEKRQKIFTPQDISDDFDETSKLMICRQLLKAGILTLL